MGPVVAGTDAGDANCFALELICWHLPESNLMQLDHHRWLSLGFMKGDGSLELGLRFRAHRPRVGKLPEPPG